MSEPYEKEETVRTGEEGGPGLVGEDLPQLTLACPFPRPVSLPLEGAPLELHEQIKKINVKLEEQRNELKEIKDEIKLVKEELKEEIKSSETKIISELTKVINDIMANAPTRRQQPLPARPQDDSDSSMTYHTWREEACALLRINNQKESTHVTFGCYDSSCNYQDKRDVYIFAGIHIAFREGAPCRSP